MKRFEAYRWVSNPGCFHLVFDEHATDVVAAESGERAEFLRALAEATVNKETDLVPAPVYQIRFGANDLWRDVTREAYDEAHDKGVDRRILYTGPDAVADCVPGVLVETPGLRLALADAFEAFWNPAANAAQIAGDAVTMATVSAMCEGFAAVSRRLREDASE